MGPDGTGGPATIEPLCSGTNSDCSYCGCARAEADAPARACASCPIRCGSRTDIAAWMADVGGTLTFDDITLGQAALPENFPIFIPQVDGSAITEFDEHLNWPAYAIGLRRVFSPATHEIAPRFTGTSARDALALKPGQLAVLAGYGEDPLVEAFWSRRHDLIGQIADQAWDLVLACNYSIYGNWPRTEHLINMRRSLLLARELADAGAPAVPNLYWFRLEDLRRLAAWVTDTNPPAVAVNAQTVRDSTAWDSWLLPGLCWLAENLPGRTPVIITGLSRADRIMTCAQLFGTRLTVISQNPYQYALHGAIMTAAGRQDMHARAPDAFAATVRYMASLLPSRGSPP
jgi:hypothetical protein